MNRINEILSQHRGKLWIAQAVGLLVWVCSSVCHAWRLDSRSGKWQRCTLRTMPPEKAAEIWTCSMHPQIRRDGPGKCPICGMDLVPVKKSASGVRTISISPDVMKLMNVQTVPVTHRYVTADVRMVGKVDYDETRLAHITAWVSGRLDRLFVDFTGVEVNKGDHMVSIYSEELYTAQEELISAIQSTATAAVVAVH